MIIDGANIDIQYQTAWQKYVELYQVCRGEKI